MKRDYSYKGPFGWSTAIGSTYGVVWRGDESPLRIYAHRARSSRTLSEAKPRTIEQRKRLSYFGVPLFLGMEVGIGGG